MIMLLLANTMTSHDTIPRWARIGGVPVFLCHFPIFFAFGVASGLRKTCRQAPAGIDGEIRYPFTVLQAEFRTRLRLSCSYSCY